MFATAADTGKRLLGAADVIALREVSSPAISPDGNWVAYLATVSDTAADELNAELWLASWDGRQNLRLTQTVESESTPRWSPDGRFLAFIVSPGDDAPGQLWLLDRRGGEARQLGRFAGDVSDFAWAPDGERIAVIASDAPARGAAPADPDATPAPIVVERFYFKEDETGYLGAERERLYLLDVASGRSQRLTRGVHDETRPAWSPDGRRIAFLGRASADPDRDSEFTLFTMAPRAGATPRALASFQGENGDSDWMSGPVWSPDGKRIAYTAGGDPKLIYYATHKAMVIAAGGGKPRVLGAALDRNMVQPRWSRDGTAVLVLLEDDRNQQLARIALADDRVETLAGGRRETLAFDIDARGRTVLLDSSVERPHELFALEDGVARPLSKQNDAWLEGVQLASVEETAFASRDGTQIHGFLVKPPGFRADRKYPAVLDIHGGPVAQFANTFMIRWQVLAAQGYVVIAANPRGSSGRGEAFASAIYADWGSRDGEDVLAAVDHAVRAGIADPQRLGVGGWSYGGILTNYVIARDTRFKAATSGAGISNILAGYGTDMYTREYETELGKPWENTDLWLRLSRPFLHADRIVTPTLFLCGERDFNVPLPNSEQMYQALKSLGVDTQLVIYPDQYHGLDKPSYLQDRLQRQLDWFGKYLRGD